MARSWLNPGARQEEGRQTQAQNRETATDLTTGLAVDGI